MGCSFLFPRECQVWYLIVSYLQSNMSAYYCFRDPGKTYETLGSEPCISYSTASKHGAPMSMFALGPLLLYAVAHRKYMLQLRNTQLRKSACLLLQKDIKSHPSRLIATKTILSNGPRKDGIGSCIFGAFVRAVGGPYDQGKVSFPPLNSTLCLFLIVGLTGCHKLCASRQHIFIILQSWGSDV